MENLEIRKFELNDIKFVYELLNELYNGKIKFDIFEKTYKDKLEDKFSYNIVAVLDGKIIGILVSEISVKMHRAKKCSFIDDIIVDKNYRGNGVGKLLLESAINYSIEQDCEVIELTSYLSNEDAHRFYEKNGFKKHSYKFKKYLNTY
jgi:PhnO protein